MSYHYEKNTQQDDHGEVEIFENYLRTKGLKLTQARRKLLALIFANHSHFTAESLFDQCRQARLPVSKATLYRSLTILLDCKLLVAHDFGEGAKFYEHVYGHTHHDHFFCMVCKRIAEFRSERIESIQDEAARELGFRPVRHSLSIYGVCEECYESPEGKRLMIEREEIEAAEAGAAEAHHHGA